MGRIITIQGGKISKVGERKATAGNKIDRRYKDSVEEWIAKGTWIGVRSSNVAKIRYEKAAQRMWVIFKKGGRRYHYDSVTAAIARKFYNAASMGKFVWAIRRAGYVGIEG